MYRSFPCSWRNSSGRSGPWPLTRFPFQNWLGNLCLPRRILARFLWELRPPGPGQLPPGGKPGFLGSRPAGLRQDQPLEGARPPFLPARPPGAGQVGLQFAIIAGGLTHDPGEWTQIVSLWTRRPPDFPVMSGSSFELFLKRFLVMAALGVLDYAFNDGATRRACG